MTRRNFIRAIEYWLPEAEGGVLAFGGGLFGGLLRFEAATRDLCFGRGEGLPGLCWELGHPLVLKDLQHSYFRRGAAARAEGITCGIALPVTRGDAVAAVVVVYCGDDDAHAGAIELWRHHPAESADLTLVDGYYGSTGDAFEFISRNTAFRRGTGLPGMAWEQGGAVCLPDLGKGSGFLRADGAVKVGINRGIALPCSTLDGSQQVLTLLSALATPFARRIESWEPQAGGGLARRFALVEPEGLLPEAAPEAAPALVAQAYDSGLPVADAAAQAIALPVAPEGRIAGVLTLHL